MPLPLIILAITVVCVMHSYTHMNVLTAPQVKEQVVTVRPTQLEPLLVGDAEDDVLAIEATAVLNEAGQTYEITAKITNKSDTGLSLIYNCGTLILIPIPESDEANCTAVYSMLLKIR